MSVTSRKSILLLMSATAFSASWVPAFAQGVDPASSTEQGAESGSPEIIVTARKRSEGTMDVPMAITALSSKDISRYGANNLVAISQQVPGLIIQPMANGAGGSVALRGISSSVQNPAIDQSVSFNIDGVQVSSANIIRLGQIDIQQLEILKGPQALFFGKNSPGGVISIRSADPSDRFEAKLTGEYEFKGDEAAITGVVSGPVTDTLGFRLLAHYNQTKGYFENNAKIVPGSGFGPGLKRGPNRREIYLRATMLFEPTDTISIRAKYNFDRVRAKSSPFAGQQRIGCPYGAYQVGAYPLVDTDCRQDGNYVSGQLDPRLVAVYPHLFPYEGSRSRQHLASIEGNAQLAQDITLTSVSGLYKINDGFRGSASYQSGSPVIAGTDVSRRDLTQELRIVTAKKDWPVNFTVGAFYQDGKFQQGGPTIIASTPGTVGSVSFNEYFIDTKSYSFFGQAIWTITPQLELAGGVRYTSETKDFRGQTGRGVTPAITPIVPTLNHVRFTDTSPEVTLTWKPSSRFTVFGGWRNGFKSGGFNTGGSFAASGRRIDYRPEDIKGFEGGIKGNLGSVRFGLTAYTYRYKDLQVSTFDPVQLVQTVVNAASARIKGVEADANWATPVNGLSLRGSLNYNHARYTQFLSGCYTGQTIAEGCSLNPSGTGVFRQQNLSGRPLTLAPDWSGSAGFSYETPLSEGLKLSITGDTQYSSGFWAQLEEAPLGKQSSYWMFNASARLLVDDDRYEVALIGRNLSDVYRSRFVSQVPLTGISARTGTATAGGLSDISGLVNRGRELRLQLTARF